jgi:hypothetical protein
MKTRAPLPIGPLESIQACTPKFSPPHRRRRRIEYVGWLVVIAFFCAVLASAGGYWR